MTSFFSLCAGIERGTPSDIVMPPESNDEPSEMRSTFQELGIDVRPGPSGVGEGAPRPLAFTLLGLAGCGAASLAASTAAMTLDALDRIATLIPIGAPVIFNRTCRSSHGSCILHSTADLPNAQEMLIQHGYLLNLQQAGNKGASYLYI